MDKKQLREALTRLELELANAGSHLAESVRTLSHFSAEQAKDRILAISGRLETLAESYADTRRELEWDRKFPDGSLVIDDQDKVWRVVRSEFAGGVPMVRLESRQAAQMSRPQTSRALETSLEIVQVGRSPQAGA